VWPDTKPDSHSYGHCDRYSKLHCYSNSDRYIYRERDCGSNRNSKRKSLGNADSYG
jgi:hypothetical protein